MRTRRSIRTRLLLALLVLGGVVVFAIVMSTPNGGRGSLAQRIASTLAGDEVAVPDWLAERLLRMVNSKLRPQLSFADLDYAAPATITLRDAALTTPEGERIVEVETLVITLAERPRRDEPIRFAGVEFRDGVVRLIVTEADAGLPSGSSPEASAGLAGFSRMLPDDRGSKKSQSAPGTETPSQSRKAFSDAVELRGVTIDDFTLEYIPGAGGDPLRLDHIAASLDLAPEGEGWYTIGLRSGRAPAFEFDLDGRLNLDTLDAEIRTLAASIDASPETIPTLPTSLESFMKTHDIRGMITATGRASADLRNLGNAEAALSIGGTALAASLGSSRIPIDRLSLDATLRSRVLNLESFEAAIHDGTILATGSVELSETGARFTANWEIQTVEVSHFLREQSERPRLAGLLSGAGKVASKLEAPRASLKGSGSLDLKKGRLLRLPGFSQLIETISGKDPDTRDAERNHKGSALFTLDERGATITESEFVTNLIAAHGTGLVSFDRTLDLRFNGGPLEKIQNLLGPVGELFGKVTDRLLKYTVKGPFENPSVGVAPLGID